jgi:hypothetical protein
MQMLGKDSGQRSFFDAGLAVEGLVEPGSFPEVLSRLGPRLLADEDFADCYDVTTGRPSVPPSRMFKLVPLQAYEDLSDRKAIERIGHRAGPEPFCPAHGWSSRVSLA